MRCSSLGQHGGRWAIPRLAVPVATVWLITDDSDPAVQGLPDEREHARMAEEERQPLQDLLRGPSLEEVKDAFVSLLHALFQLLCRHIGRLEDRVGPPILVAVVQQKSPLALQLVVDWSARIGREDVKQRIFQPHLLDMGLRGLEDLLILTVKAEHEEALHQNAMLVKAPHHLLIILDLVLHRSE